MTAPAIELVAVALRNLDEVSDVMRRAELLDAAASILIQSGDLDRGQQARTTAQILREAQSAQLRLSSILNQAANA
ncbi:MAG: hypothetical protein AAGB14_04505 [Verrucomicrobiota bacterium]